MYSSRFSTSQLFPPKRASLFGVSWFLATGHLRSSLAALCPTWVYFPPSLVCVQSLMPQHLCLRTTPTLDRSNVLTPSGAFCIGNFTYAFPALLKIGFDIKKGAMLPDEHFNETTRKYVRLDNGLKRWIRGYKKTWMLTTANIIYMLGALVVCGMGCYSAISALMSAFGDGATATTAFSCISPYAA